MFLKDKVAAATLAYFKLLTEGNVTSTEISGKSNSFTHQGQAVAFYFEVNVQDFVFASCALIFVSVKAVIFIYISVPNEDDGTVCCALNEVKSIA